MTLTLVDPVDAAQAAERFGVKLDTFHQWRKRAKRGVGAPFPEEATSFGHVPVWEWLPLLQWAGATGRLTTEDLRREYAAAAVEHGWSRPATSGELRPRGGTTAAPSAWCANPGCHRPLSEHTARQRRVCAAKAPSPHQGSGEAGTQPSNGASQKSRKGSTTGRRTKAS